MRSTRLFGLDSLRGSLRLFTFLLVLLPVALAGTFFSLFDRERILRVEQTQLLAALRQDRTVIRSWLETRLENITFLADQEPVRRGDRDFLARSIRGYLQAHSHIYTVVYVNTDGVVAFDPKGNRGLYLGDRDYIAAAKAGRASIATVDASRATGGPLCVVCAPVIDLAGHYAGAIFMPVELVSLDHILGQTALGKGTGAVLTDSQGRILAPTGAAAAANGAVVAEALQRKLPPSGRGAIFRNRDGLEMVGAALPLQIDGWRLVREIPTATVLAGYRRQPLFVALGGLATVLLITPLVLQFCRRLERPMGVLSRYARELQAKRYDMACSSKELHGMPVEMRELFETFCTMASEVRRHIEESERLSIQDPLTGLYNRRFLFDGGAKLLEAAQRAKRACCCLMLDVDHFKEVNDSHGHQVGDQALAHIAWSIASCARKSDLVARYGGEEFVVLLTGADRDQGRALAERIRRALADRPCRIQGRVLPVTVSIGVAEARQEVHFGAGMLDDLLVRADRAMYQAKAAGRDQVAVET